ncbi:hypothetical protein ACB092_06G214700 [Castanea dentata]
MEETNVSLRLLIDTKSQKVLFAEADKNFIDFLFNILALPLGTFIALLTKQGMVGSLGNIYESIENLSTTYLLPNVNKETLLKPKVQISGGSTVAGVPLLLPKVESSSTSSRNLYRCSNSYNHRYVADDSSAKCPSCNCSMSGTLIFVDPPRATNTTFSGEGGCVKGVVTYMVMDDLAVKPMSTISSITVLNRFNVKDVSALEEKVVHLGIDEGVKLLEASIWSKSALTDVFLPMLKQEVQCESQ